MAKKKVVVANSALGLAKLLRVSRVEAYEWEVQSALLDYLKKLVKKENLTHVKLAKLAGSSRTRITSILNGNLEHVSTDLLIRLLGSMGYEVNVSVTRAKIAA